MGAVPRVYKHVIVLSVLATPAACDTNNDFTNVVAVVTPVATTLSVNASSNGQTGIVGTALALPLSVRVLDQNGNAMSSATVSWAVVGQSGSLSAAASTSDANGGATVVWTLGNTVGIQSVRASLASGAPVFFTATATAGAFVNLVIVSGDLQFVQVGSATQPLVVRAVDQFGNAVAGVQVTWSSAGAGTLSVTSGPTDKSGLAEATLTTLNPGSYAVTASAAGPFVIFTGSSS